MWVMPLAAHGRNNVQRQSEQEGLRELATVAGGARNGPIVAVCALGVIVVVRYQKLGWWQRSRSARACQVSRRTLTFGLAQVGDHLAQEHDFAHCPRERLRARMARRMGNYESCKANIDCLLERKHGEG